MSFRFCLDTSLRKIHNELRLIGSIGTVGSKKTWFLSWLISTHHTALWGSLLVWASTWRVQITSRNHGAQVYFIRNILGKLRRVWNGRWKLSICMWLIRVKLRCIFSKICWPTFGREYRSASKLEVLELIRIIGDTWHAKLLFDTETLQLIENFAT